MTTTGAYERAAEGMALGFVLRLQSEEAQDTKRIGHATAGRGGDVAGSGFETLEADGEVAQCCHHPRPRACPDLRTVLIVGHVSDPMELIFNRPVIPTEPQESGW